MLFFRSLMLLVLLRQQRVEQHCLDRSLGELYLLATRAGPRASSSRISLGSFGSSRSKKRWIGLSEGDQNALGDRVPPSGRACSSLRVCRRRLTMHPISTAD